jgi:hypothetical protein
MAEKTVPLYKHRAPHREILRRYRSHIDKGFWMDVAPAAALFVLGLIANNLAIAFSTERASNAVTDLVLSNIPVFDLDGTFVYGTLIGVAITVAISLAHPRRIPFALYAAGTFFIIRSGFVSLTHIAPFLSHPTTEFTNPVIIRSFFGADLFFSGHTGLPFLGALIFWREHVLRYFYLALSVFFAAVVLLAHLHYSIDVASAFFITYTIYHITIYLYPRSYARFCADELASSEAAQ